MRSKRSMVRAVIVVLTGACHPPVISGYGSMIGARDPYKGGNPFRAERHDGVDIRADEVGHVVLASAPGRVAEIRESPSAGMVVMIEHRDFRRWTSYIHLRSVSVEVGSLVERGEKIGEVGLFPYSAGIVHVHWMLCTKLRCYGYGREGGTADPIELTDGCYDAEESYPADRLVLTYPIDC